MDLSFLSDWVGKNIQLERGGPDELSGTLVAVGRDFITVRTDSGRVVSVKVEHIQTLAMAVKEDVPGVPEVELAEYSVPALEANDFRDLLSKCYLKLVQVNAGGPNKLVGVVIDQGDDWIKVVHGTTEFVTFPIQHIKSVSLVVPDPEPASSQQVAEDSEHQAKRDGDHARVARKRQRRSGDPRRPFAPPRSFRKKHARDPGSSKGKKNERRTDEFDKIKSNFNEQDETGLSGAAWDGEQRESGTRVSSEWAQPVGAREALTRTETQAGGAVHGNEPDTGNRDAEADQDLSRTEWTEPAREPGQARRYWWQGEWSHKEWAHHAWVPGDAEPDDAELEDVAVDPWEKEEWHSWQAVALERNRRRKDGNGRAAIQPKDRRSSAEPRVLTRRVAGTGIPRAGAGGGAPRNHGKVRDGKRSNTSPARGKLRRGAVPRAKLGAAVRRRFKSSLPR
ncbi:MAG: hypothetical protein K6T81_05795 [Alicyclobacillus macrosporangiidus]|uniref:hypothetical protein n=1 Tax=Alicyclobacillus macrosporangiidus TaxID=392015 RepID=UPI0026F02709|nr:hypothetical protein [Alicyclobacillus macrosporangiidus]MCL6598238.1 hypothetical protein [Alicyclobacillus macrosporangiidus]